MSSEIEMRGAQAEDQFCEKFASNQGLGDFTKADWNLTGAENKVNRRRMTNPKTTSLARKQQTGDCAMRASSQDFGAENRDGVQVQRA